MTETRKGLVDPWQRGKVIEDDKDADKTGVGLPGSDHALDWDILPDVSCTLRVPGAYGSLTVHGARSLQGAATLFLQKIEGCTQLREYLKESGFHYSSDPKKEPPTGYMIYTPDKTKVLYNPQISGPDEQHTVRRGFSQLVRILLRASRQDHKFRALLKTLGIEPLLS